ncbi:hypothetical protein CRG98_013663 [Punica granatum]|uniref:Uncharacterized protein n=1 Tax=Punica granatum TaxID=22663 RepID=A0A2I0KCV8_PUNGR|nr:hypothetical protein CRG98_013663 [Punica granatum]
MDHYSHIPSWSSPYTTNGLFKPEKWTTIPTFHLGPAHTRQMDSSNQKNHLSLNPIEASITLRPRLPSSQPVDNTSVQPTPNEPAQSSHIHPVSAQPVSALSDSTQIDPMSPNGSNKFLKAQPIPAQSDLPQSQPVSSLGSHEPIPVQFISNSPQAQTSSLPVHPTTTNQHQMTTRAKSGIHKPNPKFSLLTSSCDSVIEPTCYSQAVKDPNWRQAMADEFNALIQNGTWSLVPPNAESDTKLVLLLRDFVNNLE